jgi:hypothetical protein
MITATFVLCGGISLIGVGVKGLKAQNRNSKTILIGGMVMTLVGTIALVLRLQEWLAASHAFFRQ